MGENRITQVGVVGGGIRGGMFARAIQENPDAEVAAVCDRSPTVLEQAAAALRVPGYAEVGQMLAAHPELDAAVIATPDFAHRDAAVACAEAGLDLMVEKPLATTVEDAEAIAAAARRSGARVMVGFENRWNPRFSTMRDTLRAFPGAAIDAQVVNLNDTVFVPTRMLSWAARSSPAWFLMPHTLDLACWVGGTRPVSVRAVGSRRVLAASGVDTWDRVNATFEMADGSHVFLNSSWVLPESSPAVYDFRYEVQSAAGVFHVDGANHGVVEYGRTGVRWLQSAVYERGGRIHGVPIEMVGDFVRHVRGEDVPVPGLEDGLASTRAIVAVHRSLETGDTVLIPA